MSFESLTIVGCFVYGTINHDNYNDNIGIKCIKTVNYRSSKASRIVENWKAKSQIGIWFT